MLGLCTGKPGASKSLNSLANIVSKNQGDRPIYYTNIRLLMLDYRVASSFSGWFYGNYLPKLKNKAAIKRLNKIIKRVHADDEFVTLSDVPWLESYFEAANPLETWLLWVRKLYTKKQLARMEEFISNMPAETLDISHLIQFNLHFIHFDNPRDWHLLPKGSIVLIDECQQFFPPRAVGAPVPLHISKFETHRHDGFDIYLITQDRMLLDSNVRRLVNNHVHYHNAFNSNRVTRYELSKSFDADDYHQVKTTQKSLIKRPTNFYGAYFSSELHTHKFKMPKVFYILIFLILLVAGSIYSFASSMLTSDTVAAAPKSAIPSPTSSSITSNKVSIKSSKSPLLNDNEKKYLTDYVSKTVDGVFITGSQYIKTSAGLDKYDYSFSKSTTDQIFDPYSVGFVVLPINQCLVRLTFNDFTTFITCDPFHKLEPLNNESSQLAAS